MNLPSLRAHVPGARCSHRRGRAVLALVDGSLTTCSNLPRSAGVLKQSRQARRRHRSRSMDVLASRILVHPSDFERSRRFYAEDLGLAVFREWGDASEGGVVFYIGQGFLSFPEPQRTLHLKRSGWFFRSETRTTNGGASWRRPSQLTPSQRESPGDSSRRRSVIPMDSQSSSSRFRQTTPNDVRTKAGLCAQAQVARGQLWHPREVTRARRSASARASPRGRTARRSCGSGPSARCRPRSSGSAYPGQCGWRSPSGGRARGRAAERRRSRPSRISSQVAKLPGSSLAARLSTPSSDFTDEWPGGCERLAGLQVFLA